MNGVLLEAVVLLLLAATCGYCAVLSRRLKVIKEGQAELLSAIAKFDEASRRAEDNLKVMEREGLGKSRDLDALMKRATMLVNDLSVMVSAGDHIAGRIEGAIADVRNLGARKPRAGRPQ